MKKIIHITVWLILFAGIILLLSFAVQDHHRATCKKVNLVFSDQQKNGFINDADIEKMIYDQHDSLTGFLLDSINTSKIQRILMNNPYIKKAAVFKSVNGEILIDIERHTPLVRIINKDNESFYLSENGRVLPGSNKFTPFVMIASGHISDSYTSIKDSTFCFSGSHPKDHTLLSSVHHLAKSIDQHEFLNVYIEQIYVNEQGELELVPADGDHVILLGDAHELYKKLNNLITFYHQGMPKVKGDFTSINLKYTNQVVCKK
jgi:cell division protein FtsQ